MKDNILHSILTERNLSKAIRLIQQKQSEGVLPQASSAIEYIENDYNLMHDFLQRGFRDKQADTIYQGLLKKTYKLYSSLRLEHLKTTVRTFVEATSHAYNIQENLDNVKLHLEEYVQEVAFMSLGNDINAKTSLSDIYERHLAFIDNTFNGILISEQWSDDFSKQVQEMLLSPMLDVGDVELLVSAITLSCISIFDLNKWETLTILYTDCSDEHIRQRALVGWILALKDEELAIPEIHKRIETICKTEIYRKEILELQIQLFYCCNTDADNRIIQNDILPTLIKNNNLHFTRSGLIERDDDDSLKDILDPETIDCEMEKLENTFERMRAMQKAGSDIYFGGFSQMKRFTFFYRLSNWFCPYYPQHPQIASAIKKIGDNNPLTTIMSDGIFCDSDKYSFILGLSSIIDKLPTNIQEIMGNNMDNTFIRENSDTQNPAYVRRSYLQDLYRFFILYQNKNDFSNPLVWNTHGVSFFFSMSFCKHPLLQTERDKLAIFFFKHHHYDNILSLYADSPLPEGRDAKIVLAKVYLRTGYTEKAETIFKEIINIYPSDEYALKGLARIAFINKKFGQAEVFYEKLQSEHKENIKYKLNLAITRLHLDKISQGMEELYHLYYEHPEQKDIRRALAWGCLMYKKISEADKIYNTLISEEEVLPSDYLNAGYAKWIMSKIPEAVTLFRKYMSMSAMTDSNEIERNFDNDQKILSSNDIGWAEKMLMLDLVSNK